MKGGNLPATRPQDCARKSSDTRRRVDRSFAYACVVTACVSLIVLAVLLSAITFEAFQFVRMQFAAFAAETEPGEFGIYQRVGNFFFTCGTCLGNFLTAAPDPEPTQAGVGPSLWGTVWVCVACAVLTLPIGVATAVLLEEFKPRLPVLRWMHGFLQLNIANLAGVPSVVYGIIGMTAFVAMFGLFGTVNDPAFEIGVQYYDQFLSEGDYVVFVPVEGPNAPETELRDGMTGYTASGRPVKMIVADRSTFDFKDPENDKNLKRTFFTDSEPGRISRKSWYFVRLPFGRGVLAGALTLMLVVLPIVIISTQEALRAVPDSLREGALGMGSTRWQVVWNITLPAAVPGIMTGSILAMSRAIGEAAPILIIAGIVYIASPPGNLMDDFSVMPLQIFTWAARPQAAFHKVAAGGIVVLLTMLLLFNAVAVLIRHKMQKPLT